MIELFFYPVNMMYLVYFMMLCLFVTQAIYLCLLALHYRLREIKLIIGEVLLLLYNIVLVLIIITVLIHRRNGIISLVHLDNILYFIGSISVVYFIYLVTLKKKGSLYAIIGMVLLFPFVVQNIFNSYIFCINLATVILFCRLIIVIKDILYRQKKELNAFSIMDGLDTLPCGVMFYDSQGYIYLINIKMKELITQIIKKEPQNGIHFWDSLAKCAIKDVESQIIEGDVLLKTPHIAWRFSRQKFESKNRIYYEIIAIDVTDSIGAFYTLEEEKTKLERQNIETRKLVKNIEDLRKEQEYIRIRSRVHDVLSQRLTAIQRVSQTEGEVDYNTLLFLSQDAINHIKARRGGDAKELFAEIYYYFYKIGLAIELNGDLPKEEQLAFLFLAVLRESCTNAIKHAGATRIFANIEVSDQQYRIEITNNGERPKKSLIEGGGLFGIRNRIENAGGSLRVELIPEFSLIIILGRGF